ncbi:MAG: DUF1569 domain-containing protein [Pirellulaceae bacterium]
MRRNIQFARLDEVIDECHHLLQAGYRQNGNWTLGQICQHLRLTIEANIMGYPKWMTILGYPLRPILRRLLLPRLLGGQSPAGIRTAGMFVPLQTDGDREEVDALAACIDRFMGHDRKLHAHPGFGNMSHSEFEAFHAAHAAHHLSFLEPRS